MTDVDGDGIWTATTMLQEGNYQFSTVMTIGRLWSNSHQEIRVQQLMVPS
jgi:hypothetical protein